MIILTHKEKSPINCSLKVENIVYIRLETWWYVKVTWHHSEFVTNMSLLSKFDNYSPSITGDIGIFPSHHIIMRSQEPWEECLKASFLRGVVFVHIWWLQFFYDWKNEDLSESRDLGSIYLKEKCVDSDNKMKLIRTQLRQCHNLLTVRM